MEDQTRRMWYIFTMERYFRQSMTDTIVWFIKNWMQLKIIILSKLSFSCKAKYMLSLICHSQILYRCLKSHKIMWHKGRRKIPKRSNWGETYKKVERHGPGGIFTIWCVYLGGSVLIQGNNIHIDVHKEKL